MTLELYPKLLFVFVIFNLLGWWFKGQPFFSWWWIILIAVGEIVITSLMMAIMKTALKLG